MSNYTRQQIARISELDADIDSAADQGDDVFFAAVAAKDEYIDAQGIDRDRLEVTGWEAVSSTEAVEHAPTDSVLVSLDGGKTFVPAASGVRIIYKDVLVPGEDAPGELHLNATPEGLISDLWVTREEHLDHNLGTSSELLDDLVVRLVDDPVSENDDSHCPGM